MWRSVLEQDLCQPHSQQSLMPQQPSRMLDECGSNDNGFGGRENNNANSELGISIVMCSFAKDWYCSCVTQTVLKLIFLFPSAVFPLLRLSPTPGDDYNFNLDDNEGVCDLFDVQILNY